jgi:hypothetical protein
MAIPEKARFYRSKAYTSSIMMDFANPLHRTTDSLKKGQSRYAALQVKYKASNGK